MLMDSTPSLAFTPSFIETPPFEFSCHSQRNLTLTHNIAARAMNLWACGYRLRLTDDPEVFFIHGPEGQCYAVFCGETTSPGCTCPCWKKHDTCKHWLAVTAKLAAEKLAEAA